MPKPKTMTLQVTNALAGFVLLASVAHAQATAEQLARCAAMRTAALRLSCYDALAKQKPAPTAQKGQDKEPATAVDLGIAGIEPDYDQVFMESVVEERPEVLSGPRLQYPDLLRQAAIQGRVLVQAIIDTSGRAEPRSVRVIQSPNPGFDQSAKTYVLGALFRPARVHARPVRVLINLPIDFKIKR